LICDTNVSAMCTQCGSVSAVQVHILANDDAALTSLVSTTLLPLLTDVSTELVDAVFTFGIPTDRIMVDASLFARSSGGTGNLRLALDIV